MSIAEASLVTLLVKLGVVASLASILTRFSGAKRMLLREQRTLNQRLRFAGWFAVIFGAGVATRVATVSYLAVDLGLEGSLLAGMLGGYFTGLISGALIAIPAMPDGLGDTAEICIVARAPQGRHRPHATPAPKWSSQG